MRQEEKKGKFKIDKVRAASTQLEQIGKNPRSVAGVNTYDAAEQPSHFLRKRVTTGNEQKREQKERKKKTGEK